MPDVATVDPVISFLDHDHVLRLVEFGLGGAGAPTEQWARALFAPDPIDTHALLASARGLTAAEGSSVRVVAPPSASGVEGSHVLITRRGPVSAEIITACPGLKLIQRLGERSDGIDLAAAQARGVPVSLLPRKSMVFTAEHALLLMLALSKQLVVSDRLVRDGGWDASKLQPVDNVSYNWAGLADAGGLYGRTLGLVGMGEVGTLLARRAAACGMAVAYHNRNRLPQAREQALGVRHLGIDELLTVADFVVVAAANLPQNDKLIGAAALARMKPSAFLINISRGRLIDEDALYEALAAHRIAGAGLDVHRIEPRPPGDRFAGLDNVILTPHAAGGSRRFLLDEVAQVYDNCRAALAGERVPWGVI